MNRSIPYCLYLPVLLAWLMLGAWYGAYWNHRWSIQKNEPRQWLLRSRTPLLTQPLMIRTGMDLSADEIAAHLVRAGYRPLGHGSGKAASFERGAGQLTIRPAHSRYPALVIGWRDNRIAAIQGPGGAAMQQAWLEPEVLAEHIDSTGAIVRRERIRPEDFAHTHLARAIIAREDWEFYRHHGIRPQRMLRALLGNRGASTITQQTAKNLLGDFSRSTARVLQRKFVEIPFAAALENSFTKEEILAIYANLANFGIDDSKSAVLGVQAAARAYFSKGAATLELHQAALLPYLLPAPNPRATELRHDPNGRPRQHRDATLRLMRRLFPEQYSQQQIDYAIAQPVVLRPATTQASYDPCTGYVVSLLEQWKGAAPVAASHATTIQPLLQRAGCELLSTHVAALRRRESDVDAGLLAVDNTGAVLAMIGGADRSASLRNHTSIPREVASLVKVILAAVAFTMNPALSADTVIRPNSSLAEALKDCHLPSAPLSRVFARSWNCHMESLLHQTNPEAASVALQSLFRLQAPPELPLAYGKFKAQPRQVARAFSFLHNRGRVAEERFFDTQPVYTDFPVSPRAVETTRALMRAVVQPGGTAEGVLEQAGFPMSIAVYAKTGTGSRNDLWCVMMAGKVTVVAWVGADRGAILPAGQGWKGGWTAGPLAARFLRLVLRHRPDLVP